ncbi:MAG: hypothetical protein ABI479_04855 [Gallionella sp.]
MLNIGGFLELEIPKGREFHITPYCFDLARHALAAVLLKREIQTLYVPEYICESVVDAIHSVGAKIKFYDLQDIFNPVLPKSLAANEAVLLVNYYGLVDIDNLLKKVNGRVIVDNSQSFFASPPSGVDTFYSPRKFFGVPDGSYLYTDMDIQEWFSGLPATRAFNLMQHLVDRMDGFQQEAYLAFKEIRQHLRGLPMARMSETTHRLLSGINYTKCQKIRFSNFQFLNLALKKYNEMEVSPTSAPMCYPLLVAGGKGLRERLIQLGIYIPLYWPYVEAHSLPGSTAHRLAVDIVCLPIDHRYSVKHMKIIAKEVVKYFGD